MGLLPPSPSRVSSVHALEIWRGFPGVVYLLLNLSKLSLKPHRVEITVHT
jgi:hypothetical protein